jgi:hypothetical protein
VESRSGRHRGSTPGSLVSFELDVWRETREDIADAAAWYGDQSRVSVQRIVSEPGIMMGKPVVEGTRITVEAILEDLGSGDGDRPTA